MNRKTTLVLCAAILLAAVVVLVVIFTTEPTAQRAGATRETAMLVEVVTVERGSYRPSVVAMGTVAPERDIVLGPRVAGEVLEISPAFTPGGFVDRGDVLLRIDPADFENALARRRSDLEQAEADLALEMGRQDVARRDYELLDGTLPQESLAPEDRSLVLRQPQLDSARARVESARAAVELAELALRRTTIRAPFDAHVLSREANVGSQVAPGDRLGRLVGTDEYWVEAAVPVAKLRFISIPRRPGEEGAVVRLRNRSAWPEGVERVGRVDQLLGELAGQTRMARLLVSVDDPLVRDGDSAEAPPLILGSYLEAHIEADEIRDVVRLDRDYVHQDDTVWVMEEGELRIRDVEVDFRDARYVYVAEGLEEGDRVVTTNLSTVVEGAALRLEGGGGGDDDGAGENRADGEAEGGGSGGEGVRTGDTAAEDAATGGTSGSAGTGGGGGP